MKAIGVGLKMKPLYDFVEASNGCRVFQPRLAHSQRRHVPILACLHERGREFCYFGPDLASWRFVDGTRAGASRMMR